MKNKKGYTLFETMICAAVLGFLVIASVPFLSKASESSAKNYEEHHVIVQELSDINEALATQSQSSLRNNTNIGQTITISPVDGYNNLYKVTGIKTGAYGYVVAKDPG